MYKVTHSTCESGPACCCQVAPTLQFPVPLVSTGHIGPRFLPMDLTDISITSRVWIWCCSLSIVSMQSLWRNYQEVSQKRPGNNSNHPDVHFRVPPCTRKQVFRGRTRHFSVELHRVCTVRAWSGNTATVSCLAQLPCPVCHAPVRAWPCAPLQCLS